MELLKNAMRATMDFHIQKYSRDHEEGHAVTHRESVESLQSPLSNYRRIRQASAEAAHDSRGLMVVPDVDKIPPVTVIIADSPKNEDVIIKVMDEGGGIPRSKLNTIWSYLYTTAENSVQERVLLQRKDDKGDRESVETTDVASAAAALSKSPILAGLGFGLPMSRAYARYFGGDLDIISLEGYGTDGELEWRLSLFYWRPIYFLSFVMVP
jgi:signal transduction histidine kinase